MKKISLLVAPLLIGGMVGCNSNTTSSSSSGPSIDRSFTVLAPTGTPSLGLINLLTMEDVEGTVGAPTLLAPALTTGSYDMVAAPITVGARLFAKSQKYSLASTFVWGNLFIASRVELNEFADLQGKEIHCFAENDTTGVVLKSLIEYNQVADVTVNYVDAVTTSNAALLAGTADIVVTAEPSLEMIKGKIENLSIIDLQEEYTKMTGKTSYPQAGLFVNNATLEEIGDRTFVDVALATIAQTVLDPQGSAKKAVEFDESFAAIGENNLAASIPHSNFMVKSKSENKEAIGYYLDLINDYNPDNLITIPGEDFYL